MLANRGLKEGVGCEFGAHLHWGEECVKLKQLQHLLAFASPEKASSHSVKSD